MTFCSHSFRALKSAENLLGSPRALASKRPGGPAKWNAYILTDKKDMSPIRPLLSLKPCVCLRGWQRMAPAKWPVNLNLRDMVYTHLKWENISPLLLLFNLWLFTLPFRPTFWLCSITRGRWPSLVLSFRHVLCLFLLVRFTWARVQPWAYHLPWAQPPLEDLSSFQVHVRRVQPWAFQLPWAQPPLEDLPSGWAYHLPWAQSPLEEECLEWSTPRKPWPSSEPPSQVARDLVEASYVLCLYPFPGPCPFLFLYPLVLSDVQALFAHPLATGLRPF